MSGVRISDGSPTAAEEILWRLVFLIINKSRIYTEPSPSGKATDFDSVIPLVRIQPAQPRRSKLCIACSDLFYKSERAHAAAPPFQLRPAIAELAVGVPPCGRHILFLTEISILTIPSQKKDMTYGHVFLFGFRSRWSLHPLVFQCLEQVNCPSAKVFAADENTCTSH